MTPRILRALTAPHRGDLLRGLRDSRRPARGDVDLAAALDATYAWLRAAHDAGGGGGVAGWFDTLTGSWAAPYPETTGYIIPTFLGYAEATGDDDARERALRMTAWECDVQLASGAVVSGFAGASDEPAVFNTGQCLFGWATAYLAAGDERHRQAASAAASWLVGQMEPDGSWRKHLSALAQGQVHTYNTRSAWGLALAGHTFDEPGWIEAAHRNCRWALTQRDAHGWFANTGFTPDEMPLLHTIVYVLEGLQGVHALTGDDDLLQAVIAAADELSAAHRRDGGLAGRYGPGFTPGARWRCLTGEAQLATVLLRLARTVPGRDADDALGFTLLRDVARVQLGRPGAGGAASTRIAAHGGVAGSYPLWGEYCSFCAPNWAAKFFLDGLLIAVHGVDEPSFATPTTRRAEPGDAPGR